MYLLSLLVLLVSIEGSSGGSKAAELGKGPVPKGASQYKHKFVFQGEYDQIPTFDDFSGPETGDTHIQRTFEYLKNKYRDTYDFKLIGRQDREGLDFIPVLVDAQQLKKTVKPLRPKADVVTSASTSPRSASPAQSEANTVGSEGSPASTRGSLRSASSDPSLPRINDQKVSAKAASQVTRTTGARKNIAGSAGKLVQYLYNQLHVPMHSGVEGVQAGLEKYTQHAELPDQFEPEMPSFCSSLHSIERFAEIVEAAAILSEEENVDDNYDIGEEKPTLHVNNLASVGRLDQLIDAKLGVTQANYEQFVKKTEFIEMSKKLCQAVPELIRDLARDPKFVKKPLTNKFVVLWTVYGRLAGAEKTKVGNVQTPGRGNTAGRMVNLHLPRNAFFSCVFISHLGTTV